MRNRFIISSARRAGFSLIEVVLAIGIFLVTVLALVGLLGPTLQSVDEVEKTDEVSSIVNTLNAFLQNSPDIALASSRFDSIYNAVESGGEATVYIYRWYLDEAEVITENPNIKLEVGFDSDESAFVGANAIVNTQSPTGEAADFSKAAGTIYRAVLTPSSVLSLVFIVLRIVTLMGFTTWKSLLHLILRDLLRWRCGYTQRVLRDLILRGLILARI